MTSTMNGIFNRAVWLGIGLSCIAPLYAQTDSVRYDRPSLCLMMIAHPEQNFGKEIEIVFRDMDMPERFNDHSLGVRVVKMPSAPNEQMVGQVLAFADHAELPKKMVAKWFSRDKQTGTFNTGLLAQRGCYNATKQDFDLVQQTILGKNLLADAGEKLISHTFLVMCDYDYRREYSGDDNSDTQVQTMKSVNIKDGKELDEYNNYLYQKDNRLKEFRISCTSYLYRLQWTDSVANIFYMSHYTDTPDEEKAKAFKHDKTTFRLTYLGCCSAQETEKNEDGKYTNQQLVKKVCIRLRDKNLSTLQHAHPEFRIKAPLAATTPLKAYIGLKEDVTPDARYEVLMAEYTKDGIYRYVRVGVVKPVAGKIWDNRFMIGEEHDTELDATYFEQVSGGELFPGMLIREMDTDKERKRR